MDRSISHVFTREHLGSGTIHSAACEIPNKTAYWSTVKVCGFTGRLPGVKAFKWMNEKQTSRWYVDGMMVCAVARCSSGDSPKRSGG